MKPLIKAIILLFTFSFSLGICAEVQDIYTVRLPVTSQSQKVLQEAQKQALGQVLQRLTLQTETAPIQAMLLGQAQIGQYIQSYGYEKNTTDDAPWSLVAKFDGKKINQQLLNWQIPLIGDNRPVLLALILVNDNSGSRVLISQQSGQAQYQLMNQEARRWGIPLVFPANDLADLQNFQIQDIAAFNLAPLASGAKRYGVNGLLVGQINNLGNGSYVSKWEMAFGDNAFQWQLSDESISNILQLSLNNVVKKYADLFSITSDDEQLIDVQVDGVNSLAQLKKLIDYLSSIDAVAQVVVQEIEQGAVVLKVSTIGGVQVFVDSLAADAQLQLVDSDFSQQLAKLSFITKATNNEK